MSLEKQIKRDVDNQIKGKSLTFNVNDLNPLTVYEIEGFNDIDFNKTDELYIPDQSGNIIWSIKGKDQIREFFEDGERFMAEVERQIKILEETDEHNSDPVEKVDQLVDSYLIRRSH